MDKEESSDFDYAVDKVNRYYDIAVGLRQNACFGEAINMFERAAAEAEALLSSLAEEGPGSRDRTHTGAAQDEIKNALLQVRSRAKASIELLQEINGFVNTDLMNP